MGTIREVQNKDGRKTYHAEIRLKGYPHERESFRTRSQAKAWIQKTESDMRDGRHFKSTEAKRHTLADLINRFIASWLPRNPKALGKQTAILLWWKRELGHLLLSDVTPARIAEARDKLLTGTTPRGNQRTGSTVNRYLAALSKAFVIAVKEWGWLEDSPCRKVTKSTENPGRTRHLSVEEKDRLLLACRESRNTYLYAIVTLSLLTAMRQSELLNLKWKDVNLREMMLYLEQTKNGERRILPITEEMKKAFQELPTFGNPAEEYVFKALGQGSKTGRSYIRDAFEKALKRAQIKDFRFHDLRHSAASFMAMNGATQGELMAILGHKSPAMTRRYAHYSQKHLAELMNRTNANIIKKG
jgi:integrase